MTVDEAPSSGRRVVTGDGKTKMKEARSHEDPMLSHWISRTRREGVSKPVK